MPRTSSSEAPMIGTRLNRGGPALAMSAIVWSTFSVVTTVLGVMTSPTATSRSAIRFRMIRASIWSMAPSSWAQPAKTRSSSRLTFGPDARGPDTTRDSQLHATTAG
jgi:hypothetical protein